MKPIFEHEPERGGIFLGTVRSLAGTWFDLWLCDDIMGKTLVMRYDDEPWAYSSRSIKLDGDSLFIFEILNN